MRMTIPFFCAVLQRALLARCRLTQLRIAWRRRRRNGFIYLAFALYVATGGCVPTESSRRQRSHGASKELTT
jgi:hypothetical protein